VATPLALRALARKVVAGNAAGRNTLHTLAQQDEAALPPPPPLPKPQPAGQRGGGGRLREASNRKPRVDWGP
jgi:hypothetical protein